VLDFSQIPAIDVHAHSFAEQSKGVDIEVLPSMLYFASARRPQDQLLYMQLVRELAKFLRCEPLPEAVARVRTAQASEYRSYVKRLFADVNLRGILVDDGYSEVAVEKPVTPFDLQVFRELAQVEVRRVTRLEPIVKEVIDRSDRFEQFVSGLSDELDLRIKEEGVVGVKSVIAYRTGLAIEKPSPGQASQDFLRYKSASAEQRRQHHFDIKRLRDYAVWLTLERTTKHDVPMLFHTGLGDIDVVLDKCNPIHLFGMLKDEMARKANIVLVHGGYPYATEAAWLATVFENVYLDVSIYAPYSHANLASRVLEVLELAPISKVLYGSDASQLPEVYWLSLKLFRRALAEALQRLIEFDTIDEDQARCCTQRILAQNVTELFRL
jgi:predicted TIM-barrel fold metal-dependent hydrolase